MPKQASRDGVFQRKDSAGWYASYVDAAGKRRKKRVVAHTRTQAMDALNALKTRVQTERVLGVRYASDITTADLLKRFVKYQKTRLSESSFARLGSVIDNLNASLPVHLKDISKLAVADFVSERSQVKAAATLQKEVATLKYALRMAVEWDLIHSNPAERVKLPKIPEGRTRYLSPTELRSVLQEAPAWMRGPIALSAFTGMRRGEVLGLRWRDVDLPSRRAFLHETKNGTLRVLALNDLSAQVIEAQPRGEDSAPVFQGVDGEKLTTYTRRLFKRLGLEGASFHSLRHTAASWLAMSGVDLYAIGQVLGHKTPRMTQRYSHLSPGYMAGAIGKLDAVFGDVMGEKVGTPTGLRTLQVGANPA